MPPCAAPRHSLVLLAGALVLAAAATARAQPAPGPTALAAPHPTARLEYAHAANADRCPDDPAVRAAVAHRLGYDPFTDDASTLVRATIERRGRGMRARIALVRGAGARPTSRTITARGTDCVEITRAMTLAISIAIDPLVVTRPEPPPPPPRPAEDHANASGTAAPPPGNGASTAGGATTSAGGTSAAAGSASTPSGASATQSATTTTTATTRAADTQASASNRAASRTTSSSSSQPRARVTPSPGRADPWRARLGLGLDVGTGLQTAGVGFGALVHVGARWRNLSLGLELRSALPAGHDVSGGTITAMPLGATALVCGHDVPLRFLFYCAEVSGAMLVGWGSGTQLTRTMTTVAGPLVGLGGRVGLEFPIGRVLILRVHGEAAWVPTTATFTIQRNDIPNATGNTYANPPFAAAGGLGALFHFP